MQKKLVLCALAIGIGFGPIQRSYAADTVAQPAQVQPVKANCSVQNILISFIKVVYDYFNTQIRPGIDKIMTNAQVTFANAQGVINKITADTCLNANDKANLIKAIKDAGLSDLNAWNNPKSMWSLLNQFMAIDVVSTLVLAEGQIRDNLKNDPNFYCTAAGLTDIQTRVTRIFQLLGQLKQKADALDAVRAKVQAAMDAATKAMADCAKNAAPAPVKPMGMKMSSSMTDSSVDAVDTSSSVAVNSTLIEQNLLDFQSEMNQYTY